MENTEVYKTQNLAKLLQIEPPPYLIDGFLRQHTVTALSSEPHVGKTMLMLDMMLCMETKHKFLDTFDIKRNSSTIFLAQDSARWDVALQFQKLVRGHELQPKQISMFESRILLRDHGACPRLSDPKFGPWLESMRLEHGADIVMFDTHRKFHNANENDSGEMSLVMNVFEELVDKYGMTVVFATHVGKPGMVERSTNYTIRGSTVIAGSVDYHYQLRNVKGYIGLDGTAKRRGEYKAKSDDLLFEMKPHNNGLLILPVAKQLTQSPVLTAIQNGADTAIRIAKATGMSYYDVQNHLRNLKISGKVTNPKRGIWAASSSSSSSTSSLEVNIADDSK